MTNPRIVSTPSLVELKQQYIREYRLAAIDAGLVNDLAIGPGSDVDLDAAASANMASIAIAKVQIAEQDANLLSATGEALDAIREAEGLPIVVAGAASGKIVPVIDGATTINDGEQIIYDKNGIRASVTGGPYVNPTNGTEISVLADDVGEKTNLKGGEGVRFVSPPTNVQARAKVSTSTPITDGTDTEGDERKRQRILNVRRNRPAGGNWSQMRQDILDELPGVQDVYVYPALGGPSSCKVIPVRDFDLENLSFSRACSTDLLNRVRAVLWGTDSSNDNIVVQASVDISCDIALQVLIPDAALSGGNGLGWADAEPWPQLEVSDGGRARVTSWSFSGHTLVVDADTATPPVPGQTTVAWWSTSDMTFYTAMVIGVSGGVGAWSLTLDRALANKAGSGPTSGDFISPPARNLVGYGKQLIEVMRTLGAGEQTTDVGRLPRAKRHPYITDEDPSDVTTVSLGRLPEKYKEITELTISYAPTSTPPIPSDVDTAAAILVPRHFGVYPL